MKSDLILSFRKLLIPLVIVFFFFITSQTGLAISSNDQVWCPWSTGEECGYYAVSAGSATERAYSKLFIREGYELLNFFPYDQFRGEVTVTRGDVNNDGADEYVTAPSKGNATIRVWSLNRNLKAQFSAYETSYRGGADVAVGDINGDGVADVVTSPLSKTKQEIRVFSFVHSTGRYQNITSIEPYPSSTRGVKAQVADLDGDGVAEIITVPRDGTGMMKIFSWSNNAATLVASGEPFPSEGGAELELQIGDVIEGSQKEIIVLKNTNSASSVNIFSWDGASTLTQSASFRAAEFARGTGAKGFMTATTGNIEGTETEEIVIASGGERKGLLRVWQYSSGVFRVIGHKRLRQTGFGWNLLARDIAPDREGSKHEELIVAPQGNSPTMMTLRFREANEGNLETMRSFYPFSSRYRNNIRLEKE